MIAFIGVRISWDIVERKSVFALFAASASLAADWSCLLKMDIFARSNTNSIKRPVETKQINSQFSLFTPSPSVGIKLISVHPSAASTGVWATMHFSPRELSMVKEPVDEVISPKSSCEDAESVALYDL